MTDAHTKGTIWGCKIGLFGARPLPVGCDAPMRRAVKAAFRNVVGEDAEFTFSGWSAELTEPELAVVENRLPDPAHYAEGRLRDAAPDLLSSLIEVVAIADRKTDAFDRARAAILKATSTEQGERG